MGLAALMLGIMTVMFLFPGIKLIIKGIRDIKSFKYIFEKSKKILSAIEITITLLFGVASTVAGIFFGMLCFACFDTIGTF